jgi:lysozyme
MKATKTSEKGLELIKYFEGFRENAYKCPAGVVTIGYGSTYYENGSKIKINDIVDKERATDLLNGTLRFFELEVDKMTRDDITQDQFDALVSFAYNVGSQALRGSTLLKKVNKDPNDKTISLEFTKWVKAGGKTLAGLVTRRISESKLYSSGILDFKVK